MRQINQGDSVMPRWGYIVIIIITLFLVMLLLNEGARLSIGRPIVSIRFFPDTRSDYNSPPPVKTQSDSGRGSSYDQYDNSSGSDPGSSGSSGSVHVKGYTRKDGTQVHSYTRSAPHKH